MEINRCVGCEQEIENYPCPHCGYDIATPQPEYALPYNHILHGRYLIGKVLGQGGFGITYVGWDLALELKVAIKEYYPNGQVTRSIASTCLNWYTNAQAESLRQNGMETFLKEARKMAKTERIPEVVRVRDTFAENETAYIVMDFVEGKTLKEYLDKKGALGWEDARKIFFPVMSAMERVHKTGLIHRDLSPDNLMLTPEGEMYILDLGAAKDLSVNSGLSSMQVAKNGFSPLEQYTQRGGTGPWSDVYALAATMYYSLTGILPPTAIDRLEEDTIDWSLPQLRALPPTTQSAIKQAMSVLNKERTQNMGELLEQMQQSTEPRKLASPKTDEQNGEKRKLHISTWGWILCGIAAVCIVVIGTGRANDGNGQKPEQVIEATVTSEQDTAPTIPSTEPMQTVESEEERIAFEPLAPIPPNAKRIEPVFGTIDAGINECAGLQEDGTVVYASNNAIHDKSYMQYTNAEQVILEDGDPAVLRNDGAVLERVFGEHDARTYPNIVQIAANKDALFGLQAKGTLLLLKYTYGTDGKQKEITNWTGIKAVSMDLYSVGLKSNGTVVIAGDNPPDVSKWSGIISVSTGEKVVAGLHSDGTVTLAIGGEVRHEANGRVYIDDEGNYYDCPLIAAEQWTDIVAISVGKQGSHIVGLRSDGTVVAAGDNNLKECNVRDWTDVVAVSAGHRFTVGLKADGTVIATGRHIQGISQWSHIRTS